MIKDWKKETVGINGRLIWTSKNMGIEIFKSNKDYVVSRWKIEDNCFGKELPLIHFKTKAQALKFAKAYMRTH